MPTKLTPDGIEAQGIQVSASLMDNGEYRYRLMYGENNLGYGYILTQMPPDGCGWQNSHFHQGVMETYIVQEKWIGYAELTPNGDARFSIYRPGELFTTPTGQAHNVYMPRGAVIHTVKHGTNDGTKDWHASPELDELTHPVTESQLFILAGVSDQDMLTWSG